MSKPVIVPVIMSGGAGTRLWPLSRPEKPKQMHKLFGNVTLLQETAARVPADCGFTAPIVICATSQCEDVRQQLSEIGIEPVTIIGEPVPRNTAPCADIAARAVADLFGPEALVLLLASDHFIADSIGFRAAIHQAASVCQQGHIITFGPEPVRPETGYGYLLAGAKITDGICKLDRFVEKPDLKTAEKYIEDGNYLWNSGMFLFPAELMLSEIAKYRPEIAKACQQAYKNSVIKDAEMLLDADSFSTGVAESIDNAVMENTDIGAVIALDVGWSDVGSWQAIYELSQKDFNKNACSGQTIAVDSENCLIRSDGIRIAAAGVQDMAIIANGNDVLIMPLKQAQKVRKLVEQLDN